MKKKLLAAIAAFTLIAPSAQAASDYLLELDGVKGESKDDVHKETIEIQSFSWGASNPTATATGGGGGAGKVVFQDIHFTMSISKASPQLLMACAQGRHIPKAKLFVRKAGTTEDYLVITLTDVMVSSYSSSGGGTSSSGGTSAGSRPMESLSLNFTKVEMSYTADDGTVTTGSAGDSPVAPQ